MNRDEDTIHIEALRWHEASIGDDMDWDGFTAWLEADTRHRDAYDTVSLSEALIGEHREALRDEAPRAANDDAEVAGSFAPESSRSRRGWWRWAGMAIAASLVAVIAVPALMPPPDQTFATGDANRTIALRDGSTVILAPRSSLTIEGRGQDRIALNGGAWFDIRHDPARALSIRAQGVEIVDIGTRFDVQATPGFVRVQVAEGSVSVASANLDTPIRLAQGHGLDYDARAGTAVVEPVRPDDIGEWRSGRLTFESTPLALVAADISRYAGIRLTVAQGLRDREFSGTLVISDGEAAARDLSQLMDIELRSGPAGLVLDQRR